MNLDFLTYLQLVFYVILGLAILMGFMRGMKKTLFTLITMVIFYVVFFVTIIPVSKWLWTMQMPWLGGILGNIDSSLSGFTSFEESIGSFLQLALGNTIDLTNPSAELMALVTGIGQFALKIVYTVLYFSIILLLYKIICWILGAIILGKTEKGESKNRGFGALFGVANGIMAIFIMLIMMGGIMSVVESTVTLIPTESEGPAELVLVDRFSTYEASKPIIALAEPPVFGGEDMDQMVADLQAMIDSYNNNLFVKLASGIEAPSIVNAAETVPLHINLFDRVLSFDYNDKTVAIRYELTVLSGVVEIFLTSEYMSSKNLADITGEEIRLAFVELGKSTLIISILPLAIEIGAEMNGTELPITSEELYAIDFEEELPKVGAIIGALFDILNDAGVITGEGDVEDVVITPQVVRDLFQNMSESQIVVLAVESILVPMLESSESGAGAIIRIPADLDWEVELIALGEVVAEIFDQDISFNDLMAADSTMLINTAAAIDIDVIMNSRLLTATLINILSGEAGLEGLEFLSIPNNINWLDEDNNGELRNILVALSAILNLAADIDIQNIGIDTIAELDDAAIEDLFGSYVLTATISDMLLGQDFGGTAIVIPDSVFDDQGYIFSEELIALAKAMVMIVSDTIDGTEFDITKALTMTETEIDKFLASEIIATTVGKMIVEMEIDLLAIPATVTQSIQVDAVATTVVKTTEIKKLLLSLAILELDNFDSMAFDATILNKFELDSDPSVLDDDLISTFLDSQIIHASVSAMLIDLGDGGSSLLVLPSLNVYGNSVIATVGSTDYVDQDEITALFKALHAIDLDDFNNINLDDTSLLLANMTIFLESAILHATISDQVLGIDPLTLVIPFASGDPLPVTIRITQAETEFIVKDELEAFFDAVEQLGFDNPTEVDTVFDLTTINEDSEQELVLASSIMHATISNKLINFGDTVLVVPQKTEDDMTDILYETGPVGNKTEFILKTEIKAFINALPVLGINSIDTFDGTMDLSLLFASQTPLEYASNQDLLLSSAMMQATISDQILALDDSVLIVPDTDVLNNQILSTVSGTVYITSEEIKAIIDSIDVLTGGTSSTVDSMTGTFTLANISDVAEQDLMLLSASMHATISERLFEVDSAVLTIPEQKQDGLTDIRVDAGLLGFEREFVIKAEIKALIDALILMGYSDLDNFTAQFDLTQVIDNAPTILLSASIQAMFSARLLDDTGSALYIPDLYFGSANEIRIVQTDVTYIEYDELVAFIHSLDLLQLDSISDTWSFTPANIFAIDDFTDLVASEIMQATISYNILSVSKNETEAPDVTDFVIPLFFHQAITVATVSETQIEADELVKILTSLKLLEITSFGDDIDADKIDTIFQDETDRNIFVNSGSIHITLDNMIKQNPDVGSSIPALAQEAILYDIVNVTKKVAIINFVLAVNALSSGDNFTEASFSFATILTLSPSQQNIILESMIVRNKITPETELFCAVPSAPGPYALVATDYEEDNVLYFLRKTTFEDIILTYS